MYKIIYKTSLYEYLGYEFNLGITKKEMKKTFLALAPWYKAQELSNVVSYIIAGSICQYNLNLGLSYIVNMLFYKLQNLHGNP